MQHDNTRRAATYCQLYFSLPFPHTYPFAKNRSAPRRQQQSCSPTAHVFFERPSAPLDGRKQRHTVTLARFIVRIRTRAASVKVHYRTHENHESWTKVAGGSRGSFTRTRTLAGDLLLTFLEVAACDVSTYRPGTRKGRRQGNFQLTYDARYPAESVFARRSHHRFLHSILGVRALPRRSLDDVHADVVPPWVELRSRNVASPSTAAHLARRVEPLVEVCARRARPLRTLRAEEISKIGQRENEKPRNF